LTFKANPVTGLGSRCFRTASGLHSTGIEWWVNINKLNALLSNRLQNREVIPLDDSEVRNVLHRKRLTS